MIKKAEKYEIPLDPFETKKRKMSAKGSTRMATSQMSIDQEEFDTDQ